MDPGVTNCVATEPDNLPSTFTNPTVSSLNL